MQNANWSNWSTTKIINLTYLPPGKYQLQVQLKDLHFGKTNPIELLTITISPPFWKSWWFIAASLISFVLLSYLIIKKRIATITKQEQAKGEIQKRLVETKLEALQSQMNPHFIFNAMNSIQYFIVDNNTDEALLYMGKFSKLIRLTLNHSSKIKIPLADEIKYLEAYTTLENLRFNNRITIQIEAEEKTPTDTILIPPMLVQPFVENTFIHAFNAKLKNPKLHISFKIEGAFLVCEITDNGKGIATQTTNKVNTSKGIELVKERLKLLQQDTDFNLKISSTPGKGTVVRLQIKYQ